MTGKPFVAIIMGSDSDLTLMEPAKQVLDHLAIANEMRLLSAHRTPKRLTDYIHDAEQRGCAVFIAGAGLAAHLAGVVASKTLKPVIGVPLPSGSLMGIDALLSTVQMPPGVPVSCVAIGKPGAKNAAFMAARILGLQDAKITDALIKHREDTDRNLELKEKTVLG